MTNTQRVLKLILLAVCAFIINHTALQSAHAGDVQQQSGMWQGKTYPSAKEYNKRDDFLVLDSGGTGGSFGKGDIRNQLADIHFWDYKNGWACGHGGVFHTTDGGHTWKRMRPRGSWVQIEMTGPKEIWLLEGRHPGGAGKVFLHHSTDGGLSWQEVSPNTFRHYWDMKAVPGQFWILGANGGSWRSRDGIHWNRERFNSWAFMAYKMAIVSEGDNSEIIYVLGIENKKRKLIKSTDGGNSWQTLKGPFEIDSTFRNAISFPSADKGWIGGVDGRIWRTEDGGQTWSDCSLPTKKFVTAIWFDKLGRGFGAVSNRELTKLQQAVYATDDGGRSWQLSLSGAKQINSFFSLDASHLWGCGKVPGYVANDLIIIKKTTIK